MSYSRSQIHISHSSDRAMNICTDTQHCTHCRCVHGYSTPLAIRYIIVVVPGYRVKRPDLRRARHYNYMRHLRGRLHDKKAT